jgi:hypothetical protein
MTNTTTPIEAMEAPAGGDGGASFYRWEVAGKPIAILFSLDLMDRLEREVLERFKAVTVRGSEIGGVLSGRVIAGSQPTIVIEKFEPVECDYSRGSLYLLSDEDKVRLKQTIERTASAPGVSVAGFFRSNTRRELLLDDEDQALAKEFFSDPNNVFLLVRPFAMKPSLGGFFFWEDGQLPEGSYQEFPFKRSEIVKTLAQYVVAAPQPQVVKEPLVMPKREEPKPAPVAPPPPPPAAVRREEPKAAAPAPPPPVFRREEPKAAPVVPPKREEPPVSFKREERHAPPVMMRREERPPIVPAAPPKREERPAGPTLVSRREEPPAAPAPPPPPAPAVTARREERPPIVVKREEKPAAPPVVARREEPAPPKPVETVMVKPVEPAPVRPVETVVVKAPEAVVVAPPKKEEAVRVEPPKPEPKAEPVKAEPAKAAPAKPQPPAPKPQPIVETPALSSEEEPAPGLFARLKWVFVIVLALLIVGGAGYYFFGRTAGPATPVKVADTSLGLKVETNAGQLLLSWNRTAPLVTGATRATLTINDGDHKEDVDLDLATLRNGSIVYSPISGDVSLRLEVFDQKTGKSQAESVRRLQGRPSAAGSVPVQAQQAKPAPQTNDRQPTQPVQVAGNVPPTQPSAPQVTAGQAVTANPPAPKSLASRLTAAEPPPDLGSQTSTFNAGAPELGRTSVAPPPTAPPPVAATQTKPNNPPPVVTQPKPSNPVTPPAAVGGQAQEARVIKRVAAVYPDIARSHHITGIVRVQATIGKDGRVKKATALSGPPTLRSSATDSVMKWIYSPAILDGTPVETTTLVDINFQM